MKGLLLVLAAGSALALFAGCGGDESEPAPPPGRSLATSRSLTPTAHLFGDVVEARLDVIVDRERFDPEQIRATLDFLPYRIQSGVRRSRDDFSNFTRLRWEVTLRCITIACVPSRLQSVLGDQEGRGERRTYRFKPARITYEDPETGKVSRLRAVVWPPLDAISRLSPDEEEIPSYASLGPGGEFGSTLAPVAEPSYRAPAWLLGGALLAAALALLALPGTLVARVVRTRRRPPEEDAGPSALELALRRVESARDAGDAEEQREALEALAYELDGDGRAARVRALAWRSDAPAVTETTSLVAELRGADAAPV
ncbi:MAG: hypothetical protein ACXWZB_02030 [Gaiellaceae bacterium]